MRRHLISIFILFLIMDHVWCEGHITVDGNKYELERIYWEKISGDQYYKVCKNGKYAVVKNDVLITPFKYKDIAITPAFVLYTDIGDNKMNIDIGFLTSTNSR